MTALAAKELDTLERSIGSGHLPPSKAEFRILIATVRAAWVDRDNWHRQTKLCSEKLRQAEWERDFYRKFWNKVIMNDGSPPPKPLGAGISDLARFEDDGGPPQDMDLKDMSDPVQLFPDFDDGDGWEEHFDRTCKLAAAEHATWITSEVKESLETWTEWADHIYAWLKAESD